jgi:hypothetical protein
MGNSLLAIEPRSKDTIPKMRFVISCNSSDLI